MYTAGRYGQTSHSPSILNAEKLLGALSPSGGGGHLGIFWGGYVPPGTPNWHPVLKKIPLKLIPRSRNGPIFYTPF